MNTSSRRSFLKTSVAGAVFSSSGILATTVSAQTKKWDETFDVVVVGSGFAGLAAAIEAKKAGANVIVLEKMPTAGGNSIINGGILTATGCPQQKKHNIEDSKTPLPAAAPPGAASPVPLRAKAASTARPKIKHPSALS